HWLSRPHHLLSSLSHSLLWPRMFLEAPAIDALASLCPHPKYASQGACGHPLPQGPQIPSNEHRGHHRPFARSSLSAVELRTQCHLFNAKLGKFFISRRSYKLVAIEVLPALGAQTFPSIFVLLVRCL